ncbi:MAG: hypothetical protein IKY43_01565 [Bacteroidales bacterium]|nr:hypothetical protein [Bacteroidales bacterium]
METKNRRNKQRMQRPVLTEDEKARLEEGREIIDYYVRQFAEEVNTFHRRLRYTLTCIVGIVGVASAAIIYDRGNDVVAVSNNNLLAYARTNTMDVEAWKSVKTYCNDGCSQKDVITMITNSVTMA